MTLLFGGINFTDNSGQPILPIMDRVANAEAIHQALIDRIKAETRVMIPAQVVSWNASAQTIIARPTIREKLVDKISGNVYFANLPDIPDVPVVFPAGGNFAVTFPVAVGDEVLLLFSDLCIDSWWARGGVQNWADKRRHDIADAIAIVGLKSKPNAIPSIASNAAELRTKNGNVKVSVLNNSINIEATIPGVPTSKFGSITIDSGGMALSFEGTSIELNGTSINFTGIINFNGFPYLTHIHPTPAGLSGGVIEVPDP